MIGNNMYAYCNNNPIIFVDYTGESIGGILFTLAVLVSMAVAPTICIFGSDVYELMGSIDDMEGSGELHNSDRFETRKDSFTEKGLWYEYSGGGTEGSIDGLDVGFINGTVGLIKGEYDWEYFKMDFGAGKLSGSASTSVTDGAGVSLLAETVFGSVALKIPVFGHTLSIGVTGNLGSIGASCVIGAKTEFGLSFGIGGKITILWD